MQIVPRLLLFTMLCCGMVLGNSQTFGFYCITGNNPADCAAGEGQLQVTVYDDAQVPPAIGTIGAGEVLFLFENLDVGLTTVQMSITDVYFDDGSLLGIASIINGPGVSFSQGAAPPNLPGGGGIDPPFQTTAGFLADSDAPIVENGVGVGQYLGIAFELQPGKTYDDVIAALALGFTDGANTDALRIGIHVQGFPGGGSESFVNVPEPGFYGLLSLGLAGLFLALRRRRNNVVQT